MVYNSDDERANYDVVDNCNYGGSVNDDRDVVDNGDDGIIEGIFVRSQ